MNNPLMLFMQQNHPQVNNQGQVIGLCQLHQLPLKYLYTIKSAQYPLCDICLQYQQCQQPPMIPLITHQQRQEIEEDPIDRIRKQIQKDLQSSKEEKSDQVDCQKEKYGAIQQSKQQLNKYPFQQETVDLSNQNQNIPKDKLFFKQQSQQISTQSTPNITQFDQLKAQQSVLQKAHMQGKSQNTSSNLNQQISPQQNQKELKSDQKKQDLYPKVKLINQLKNISNYNTIEVISNIPSKIISVSQTENNQSIREQTKTQRSNQLIQTQTDTQADKFLSISREPSISLEKNLINNLHQQPNGSNQINNSCSISETVPLKKTSSLNNQPGSEGKYSTFSQIIINEQPVNITSTQAQDSQTQFQFTDDQKEIFSLPRKLSQQNSELQQNIKQINQIEKESLKSEKRNYQNNNFPMQAPSYQSQILQKSKIKTEEGIVDNSIFLPQQTCQENIISSTRTTLNIQNKQSQQEDVSLNCKEIRQSFESKGMEEEYSNSIATNSVSAENKSRFDKNISSVPIQKRIKKEKPIRDNQKDFVINCTNKKIQKETPPPLALHSCNAESSMLEETFVSCDKSATSSFFQYGNTLPIHSQNRSSIVTEGLNDHAESTQISFEKVNEGFHLSGNSPSKTSMLESRFSEKYSFNCQSQDDKYYFIQQNKIFHQSFQNKQIQLIKLSSKVKSKNSNTILRRDVSPNTFAVPVNELQFAQIRQINENDKVAFQIKMYKLSSPDLFFKNVTVNTTISSTQFQLQGLESAPSAGKIILVSQSSIIIYDTQSNDYEYKCLNSLTEAKFDILKVKYIQVYPRHSIVILTKQNYFFAFEITNDNKLTIQRIDKGSLVYSSDFIQDFWFLDGRKFCRDSENIYEIKKQEDKYNKTELMNGLKVQPLTLDVKRKGLSFPQGLSVNGIISFKTNKVKFYRFFDSNQQDVDKINSLDKNEVLFEINAYVYKSSK